MGHLIYGYYNHLGFIGIIIAIVAIFAFYNWNFRADSAKRDAEHEEWSEDYMREIYKEVQTPFCKIIQISRLRGSKNVSADTLVSAVQEVKRRYARKPDKEEVSDTIRVFAAAALYDERFYKKNGVFVVDILDELLLYSLRSKLGKNHDMVRLYENTIVETVGLSKSLYRLNQNLHGRLEGTDEEFIDSVESMILNRINNSS